jgi:putative flavoprotein involved in K+ transport
MHRSDVLVIGGGQAGLAASFWLSARGIDHAVLERGRIGERWRTASWDSLRMQTPRWQSRLPGWSYTGPNVDGFMSIGELLAYLEGYARSFAAPLYGGIAVRAIAPAPDGYLVETDAGAWHARAVILATGYCDRPAVPRFAHQLSPRVHQLVPASYRRPDELPPGGVLVVGASASGVLIADELRAAGREVTIAVGGHTRIPRRHLGRDIYWWLDVMGVLTETVHDTHDLEAARRQPSMQLVGDDSGRSLDLGTLRAAGVRLVGRMIDAGRETIELADDLAATTAAADARASRLVARIDAFAEARELAPRGPAAAVTPIAPRSAPTRLSLADERISTVIWATGFRRDYTWLRVPGVVAGAELVHDGGVTPSPGLYALGLRFQRRRNSSFLDGVGDDARAVVEHLARRLERRHAA